MPGFEPIGCPHHLRHELCNALQVGPAVTSARMLEAKCLDFPPTGLPGIHARAIATAHQFLASLHRLGRLILLSNGLPAFLLAQQPDRVVIHFHSQDSLGHQFRLIEAGQRHAQQADHTPHHAAHRFCQQPVGRMATLATNRTSPVDTTDRKISETGEQLTRTHTLMPSPRLAPRADARVFLLLIHGQLRCPLHQLQQDRAPAIAKLHLQFLHVGFHFHVHRFDRDALDPD